VGGVGFTAGAQDAAGARRAREEVERNQRERLYGAMVASVAEKGYEASTVADLAEVSGVSSRTFYDLFADKRACVAQPAAARMVLIEVYAAGPEALMRRLGSWSGRCSGRGRRVKVGRGSEPLAPPAGAVNPLSYPCACQASWAGWAKRTPESDFTRSSWRCCRRPSSH
jgi:AcrR family transcriptional regulator